MPRFSIVIPTRNRPDLAAAALASVAWQDEEDCEIILSDNSTEPASVAQGRAAAERLKDDRRVRYIRPPAPLEMPDHWEFATKHAGGDYLLILTDRFVMRPGTLAILKRLIEDQPGGPPEILTWKGEASFTANGCFVETAYAGRPRVRTTEDVLQEFASSAQWRSALLGSNSLPRGLNSAVRRAIIEEARSRYGRAYAAVSPDYTCAFHQLVLARRLVELDFPFYVGHGDASNGATLLRNGVSRYTDPLGVDPFEECPLAIDTVMNTTIRDYLWVKRTTGADMPPIDMVGYLLINYRELQIKREVGSPLDVAGMRRAILAAAAALAPAEQAAFADGQAIIDSLETPAYRLRNWLAKTGALEPVKTIARRLRLYDRPRGPRYPDVLAAAQAVPLRPPAGSMA